MLVLKLPKNAPNRQSVMGIFSATTRENLIKYASIHLLFFLFVIKLYETMILHCYGNLKLGKPIILVLKIPEMCHTRNLLRTISLP